MRFKTLLCLALLLSGPAFAEESSPSPNARFLQEAAEKGDAASQTSLGMLYHRGRLVQQNDAEALKWMHKAASQGYAPAQANLGYMYYNGIGVPKNDLAAISWYNKAVAQQYTPAISSLLVITGPQTSPASMTKN